MNTPIFNALKRYVDTNPVSFYMPGHKHGRGLPQEFIDYIPKIDVTEIPGTDNLHFPEGIIKESQDLAAQLFGADQTYFLINGSSCGIHAVILTLCNHGDKLIVSRNCHKSIVAGLTLAGAMPVFVSSEYNEEFGIVAHATPEAIDQAFKEHPDAKGVIITSPNFYGVCSDIKGIAKVCHRHGKPLIVDEAHGPHLKFHESLPESAMEGGADVCIQSAHKTLLALTQASMMHVRSDLIDINTLKHILVMIQSTSPSYILLASLDIAREIVAEKGEELLGNLVDNLNLFKMKMQVLPRFSIVDQNCDVFDFDPTRLVIHCRRLGLSGFDLDRELRNRFNIQPELCDLFNVVFITTMDNIAEEFDVLFTALVIIHEENKDRDELPLVNMKNNDIPVQKYAPSEAFSMKSVRVPVSEAEGRIATTLVVPYPPGIPVLCPGEVVSKEAIHYIERILEMGGSVNNVDSDMTIEVVAKADVEAYDLEMAEEVE